MWRPQVEGKGRPRFLPLFTWEPLRKKGRQSPLLRSPNAGGVKTSIVVSQGTKKKHPPTTQKYNIGERGRRGKKSSSAHPVLPEKKQEKKQTCGEVARKKIAFISLNTKQQRIIIKIRYMKGEGDSGTRLRRQGGVERKREERSAGCFFFSSTEGKRTGKRLRGDKAGKEKRR